ncbi:SNF2-related protein [Fibrobacter sp. UWH9]|uniref:SNF2-related protein n=1 Tax=Fibrobacter sp. UWH9 TaxID=1896213 RepID=UPI001C317D5E|nr:SNF2-related protein [Fibrobacter sp. UWH9]
MSQSLLTASVDINPHQIEAALFAFKSPLSKGVILADEVGLGKTIEAGLIVSQYWAMGKKKIIIVCPASLRKQWAAELYEKFGLENEIIDGKNYNDYLNRGISPFGLKKIVITSYSFAARHADAIRERMFDLAVIDEAHKLRNVYKKNNKVAQAVAAALSDSKKLLLTATPFQNSLMELYGLTSIIDENIFGDPKAFRAQYQSGADLRILHDRLKPYYVRTLRNDVKEYINYTKRLPMTQKFTATELETKLYEDVSEFLRREDIYAVPRQQRMLTTMMIRKILASSTFALIGTLKAIRSRLEKMLQEASPNELDLLDYVDEDLLESTSEDWEDSDAEEPDEIFDDSNPNPKLLAEEIETVSGFIRIAEQISVDSKTDALLKALRQSFMQMPELGAAQKALIFTESTRTQRYLKEFLENHGFAGKVVLFNGSNGSPETTNIYEQWLKDNEFTGRISGVRSADKRAALVDYFRNKAEIMIATEAAAEGLNLQFCSLVVNYDLPWNPQRIEQRIGRCHRYGQKSDVVVVNFVNEKNFADIRVFDLLENKFHLFDDVFGASDDVLGQAETIDFERRIWQIYQECRTEEEIQKAFDQLQEDFKEEINEKLQDTKSKVLDNFDINVQERLKIAKNDTGAFLNRYEYIFWELTKFVLANEAVFDDDKHSFVLQKRPFSEAVLGKYDLFSKQTDGIPYRLNHPLAQYVLNKAAGMELSPGSITLDESSAGIKILLPDYLKKKSGYITLSKMNIASVDEEEFCLFTAFTDDGKFLSQEECEKLFLCGGEENEAFDLPHNIKEKLTANAEQHSKSKLREIDERNLNYFTEEERKIDSWADDATRAIENELDTVKNSIREQQRQSRLATNLDEKRDITKKIQELEALKRKKRHELENREDEIEEKRTRMIDELDAKRNKNVTSKEIFAIAWQTK